LELKRQAFAGKQTDIELAGTAQARAIVGVTHQRSQWELTQLVRGIFDCQKINREAQMLLGTLPAHQPE
jgi:hypothetical protein